MVQKYSVFQFSVVWHILQSCDLDTVKYSESTSGLNLQSVFMYSHAFFWGSCSLCRHKSTLIHCKNDWKVDAPHLCWYLFIQRENYICFSMQLYYCFTMNLLFIYNWIDSTAQQKCQCKIRKWHNPYNITPTRIKIHTYSTMNSKRETH